MVTMTAGDEAWPSARPNTLISSAEMTMSQRRSTRSTTGRDSAEPTG